MHPQQPHRPEHPLGPQISDAGIPAPRLVAALQFAIVAASLLAIPTMFLPWDEWINSEVNVSGSHTAGVAKWGAFATSNIPFIAATVGVVAAVAAWRRTARPLNRASGYVSAAGGLWIGIVTTLSVYSFPNDDIHHYEASTGVYVASAMTLAMLLLGATVAVTAK